MAAYSYSARCPVTAQSFAKTLIQVKAGAASIEIIEARVWQVGKTASEGWNLQFVRKSAAATVTSFTPLEFDLGGPASLAVGGTAATGYNATAEGTDTDIPYETAWNILNNEFVYVPVPEARIWIPQGAILGLKLNTSPAASTSIGAIVIYREYQ